MDKQRFKDLKDEAVEFATKMLSDMISRKYPSLEWSPPVAVNWAGNEDLGICQVGLFVVINQEEFIEATFWLRRKQNQWEFVLINIVHRTIS